MLQNFLLRYHKVEEADALQTHYGIILDIFFVVFVVVVVVDDTHIS